MGPKHKQTRHKHAQIAIPSKIIVHNTLKVLFESEEQDSICPLKYQDIFFQATTENKGRIREQSNCKKNYLVKQNREK